MENLEIKRTHSPEKLKMDDERMMKFDPEDIVACASEWQDYKRQFEVHLDSKGLHAAEG